MTPFPHFADVPIATPAQAAAIYASLKVTPAMIRFDRLSITLGIVAEVYIFALYWLALRLKFASKLRDLVERISPRFLFVQGAILYFVLEIGLAICGLPLSYYRSYVVPKRYGLTSESAVQWQIDHWKALAIDALVGGLIAGLALLLIRRYPKRWPQIASAVLIPIIAFSIFVAPIAFDPLFNHYDRLSPNRPIASEIHAVAVKAGIGNAPIYVVDKSKQTNEANAYVTGMGPSLRIVIWDTTLKTMSDREIVAILGHEMGHYVEGHLIIGFVLSSLSLFIIVPLIKMLAEYWSMRFGAKWGLRGPLSDPAAMVMLILAMSVVSFPVTPISNLVSRWIEHRADAFSLGTVRDRVGLAQAFVTLSRQDLDDPNPPEWEHIWFDTHPSLGERIHYALYGQPNQ